MCWTLRGGTGDWSVALSGKERKELVKIKNSLSIVTNLEKCGTCLGTVNGAVSLEQRLRKQGRRRDMGSP